MPDEAVINSESLEFLAQVKKGKPRKFVMICKGANIVSLVVYKKGSVDKYKKEAKKSGKGKLVHGVVDGKGPNINFKLAREEGYEEPPTRTQILKKFLMENTDLKFKPMFEIVENSQLVLDDEDPLVQRFLALQPRVLEACDRSDEAATFLNDLCHEAGQALDGDDPGDAELKILAIERALARVLGDASVSPEEQKWLDSRGQMESTVLRCLEENLRDTSKIRAVFGFAEEKAAAGDFAAALKGLSTLSGLIREALESGKNETGAAAEGVLEIRTSRLQAARGVGELERVLRATGDARALEIADIAHRLTSNFPDHLEALLEGLAKAKKAKNVEAANKIKAGARKATAAWLAYLKKHEREVEGCENNPWKIAVAINQPIKTSLKSILNDTLA